MSEVTVVSAIIPCLDEEVAIGPVVTAVLAQQVSEVVVVDGGSKDRTVERASAAGAHVIVEPRRGYGRAIKAGIAAVRNDAEIVVFLDGDGSDPAERIPDLVSPIAAGKCVFVLGSRVRGAREPGSLSPQQLLAGHVSGLLLRLVYGAGFTDLSPFRAIRRDALPVRHGPISTRATLPPVRPVVYERFAKGTWSELAAWTLWWVVS